MGAGLPAASAQTAPALLPAPDARLLPQSSTEGNSTGPKRASNLSPPKNWPSPVADERPNAFLLSNVLEYRPKANDSDFRWDIEGWYGGDYNRIWIKSEGERNTAFK